MSSVSSTTTYWIEPSTTSSSTTSSSNSTFGDFQSFLELLSTELQYQDPQDPVDSTEYVSQLAQFTTLNQTQSILNSVDAVQAYDLIGKTVMYSSTDSSGNTTSGSGTVSYVTLSGGIPYLNISSTSSSGTTSTTKIDLDDVTAVLGS